MEGGVGMLVLAFGLTALATYLLGSINFGVLVSKGLYRKDVRELGSGNAGMTNVLRNFGRGGAVLTLAGDLGKGVLGVWIGRWLFMALVPGTATLYGAYVAAVVTILGHMFPVFFKFRGGKGVATSCGVILALQPVLALILVAIFLLVLKLSGMVSLGAVVGMSFYAPLTFVYAWFYTGSVAFCTICAAIIGGLVVFMHRSNIRRIRAGTEYRFGKKGREQRAAEAEAAQEAGSETP